MRERYDHDRFPPDTRMRKNITNEKSRETAGEETAFDIPGFLENIDYPAAKEDIMDYAADSGVEGTVLEMLEQLPDTTYNSPADVSQALGEDSEA